MIFLLIVSVHYERVAKKPWVWEIKENILEFETRMIKKLEFKKVFTCKMIKSF